MLRRGSTINSNTQINIAVTHHFISGNEVRQIVLPDILVDTGTNQLCLPADIIDRLDLRLRVLPDRGPNNYKRL